MASHTWRRQSAERRGAGRAAQAGACSPADGQTGSRGQWDALRGLTARQWDRHLRGRPTRRQIPLLPRLPVTSPSSPGLLHLSNLGPSRQGWGQLVARWALPGEAARSMGPPWKAVGSCPRWASPARPGVSERHVLVHTACVQGFALLRGVGGRAGVRTQTLPGQQGTRASLATRICKAVRTHSIEGRVPGNPGRHTEELNQQVCPASVSVLPTIIPQGALGTVSKNSTTSPRCQSAPVTGVFKMYRRKAEQ